MSISLKAELEIWAAALAAYDKQDFDKALDLFSSIADSSKILTNMGLIYATVGEHETAVEHFVAATNLDSFLAIAHFQCGVSNFLMERYDLALLNFEDAYLFLRGNEAINYEQIGLKFKLFSAEVMFNKGLARLYLGYTEQGMADMQQASGQKVTNEHGVIDDAIRDRGEGYTVFSIPVGVLYRPSESKIKNSKSKDYLGRAKLVAASDSNDAFTEFTGVKKLQQQNSDNTPDNDNADEVRPSAELSGLSRNATTPVTRTEPSTAGRAALEGSNTNPQLGTGSRPGVVPSLALRRGQSASNSPNSPFPPLGSAISGNNLVLGRSNSRGPGVVSPRVKMSQEASGARVTEEIGGGSTVPSRRPSLRRRQGSEAQQSASLSPPQSLQPVTPLLLPAVPARAQGGHLTQFYEAYIDVYADNSAGSEQQRSPARTSNTNSGSSRAPSRGASAGMTSMDSPTGMGTRKGGDTARRKPSRRQRAPVYDDEGEEHNEPEMANIRIKLHYQGDVRGMTIPPTTTFEAFVERVTTKFGTPLTGLGMKFLDEEGTKISLRDESDFELAIETAKESARGRSEGKIEVWCVDAC